MAPGSSEQQPHSYRPNHAARPVEYSPETWIEITEIDDDDLQFGGKSLSEWYEEERRRQSHGSSSSDEEEHRGRQRVRKHYSSRHHKHHHHQHYHEQDYDTSATKN